MDVDESVEESFEEIKREDYCISPTRDSQQRGSPVRMTDNQPSRPFTWIVEQRRNQKYCDILLHAVRDPEQLNPDPGSQPIHAHKVILGCGSSFFAQELTESNGSLHEYIINGIDKPALEYLIDYIYTLELQPLNEESVLTIYTGAQLLQLSTVKNECTEFIKATTKSANAVVNWIFGDTYENEDLARFASEYILRNFNEVSQTDGFRNLTSDKLLRLIGIEKERKISSAQDLLKASINWLKHDVDVRRNTINEIIKEIPLNLIRVETLRQCFREDEVVSSIPSCMELYCDTIESILLDQKHQQERKYSPTAQEMDCAQEVGRSETSAVESNRSSRAGSRRGSSMAESGQILETVDTSRASVNFNLASSLLVIPTIPSKRRTLPSASNNPDETLRPVEPSRAAKREHSSHSKMGGHKNGCKKHKGDKRTKRPDCSDSAETVSRSPQVVNYSENPVMYFVCGSEKSRQRKILSYDFQTGYYEKLASYPFTSEYSCFVYHQDNLYDIGGRFNNKASSRFKILNTETNKWRKDSLPILIERRSHFSVAVLNDYIYAAGGCDNQGGINCVERISLSQSGKGWRWEEVDYMDRSRENFGLCAANGKIYAVGGYVATTPEFGAKMTVSDVVECYDPLLDKWTYKSPLNIKRQGLAVVVVDSLIYAIGGGTKMKPPYQKLKVVEVYDPEKDSWIPRAEMNHARQGFSAVVVDYDIYAIGGDSDENPTIEKFDTVINEWTMVGRLRPGGDYKSVGFRSAK